jgi:glycine cleavage system H protein
MILCGLAFPDALYYRLADDTWAQPLGDGTVRVGISALGVALAGDLYMCRVKTPGLAIAAGRAVAVVELAKSVMSVRSPVAGTIIEVNERVEQVPGTLVQDPYGQGWLARLRPASAQALAEDLAALVTGAPLAQAMAARMALEPAFASAAKAHPKP